MLINNRYPANAFESGKKFFITNTQWFGGSNFFLGTAYLVVGLSALVIASLILATHILHPRSPAGSDPDLIRRELAKLNFEQSSNQATNSEL